jgi:hypothetical protein
VTRYRITDAEGRTADRETFHEARALACEIAPELGPVRVNGVTVLGRVADLVLVVDRDGSERRTSSTQPWERKDHLRGAT